MDHVRGRGSLPAFRIGNSPYGVLPVSSLTRWTAGEAAGQLDQELPTLLRRLLPGWTSQTGNVPRVGGTAEHRLEPKAVLPMIRWRHQVAELLKLQILLHSVAV